MVANAVDNHRRCSERLDQLGLCFEDHPWLSASDLLEFGVEASSVNRLRGERHVVTHAEFLQALHAAIDIKVLIWQVAHCP